MSITKEKWSTSAKETSAKETTSNVKNQFCDRNQIPWTKRYKESRQRPLSLEEIARIKTNYYSLLAKIKENLAKYDEKDPICQQIIKVLVDNRDSGLQSIFSSLQLIKNIASEKQKVTVSDSITEEVKLRVKNIFYTAVLNLEHTLSTLSEEVNSLLKLQANPKLKYSTTLENFTNRRLLHLRDIFKYHLHKILTLNKFETTPEIKDVLDIEINDFIHNLNKSNSTEAFQQWLNIFFDEIALHLHPLFVDEFEPEEQIYSLNDYVTRDGDQNSEHPLYTKSRGGNITAVKLSQRVRVKHNAEGKKPEEQRDTYRGTIYLEESPKARIMAEIIVKFIVESYFKNPSYEIIAVESRYFQATGYSDISIQFRNKPKLSNSDTLPVNQEIQITTKKGHEAKKKETKYMRLRRELLGDLSSVIQNETSIIGFLKTNQINQLDFFKILKNLVEIMSNINDYDKIKENSELNNNQLFQYLKNLNYSTNTQIQELIYETSTTYKKYLEESKKIFFNQGLFDSKDSAKLVIQEIENILNPSNAFLKKLLQERFGRNTDIKDILVSLSELIKKAIENDD